jgi:hypothetical protein
LAFGFWLLAFGFWLLAFGFSLDLLVLGGWMPAADPMSRDAFSQKAQ